MGKGNEGREMILHGDSLTMLKTLPDESIHCCVTSPPYWGLRDYGVDSQLGLEKTPQEYITRMVEVFREVRRVLRSDGSVWLNIGDSYAGSMKGKGGVILSEKQLSNAGSFTEPMEVPPGLKPKDLCLIPFRLAIALQEDGWWVRSDIIWAKPNPMPESVTDRPTKSHEYMFLLTKSAKYYFDQEAVREDSIDDESYTGRRPRNAPTIFLKDPVNCKNAGSVTNGKLSFGQLYPKRNIRTIWTIPTQPTPEAHFATFPEALIVPCIKAGCPEGGTVLDPFFGSGTTGIVAKKLQRKYIGIELNEEYIKIAERRIEKECGGLF
jgi:DNA modification methylase